MGTAGKINIINEKNNEYTFHARSCMNKNTVVPQNTVLIRSEFQIES